MKKAILSTLIAGTLLVPAMLSAGESKGLNVLVNSGDAQTQAMAMVLSMMSMKKHKKEVNIVLCSKAGDLAIKNLKSTPVKRPNGKEPSPKTHLKKLIKMGANVQICPLYLPNSSQNKSALLKGITVAKPSMIAGKLLNTNYQNVSF